MTATASTFWTPPAIRTSPRTPTARLWRRTAPSWSSTRPRASSRRRASCSRSAPCAHIPIFTFINKMDREARNPFDLLGRARKGAGHRHLSDELADRLRQGVQGRVRPREAGSSRVLRSGARRAAAPGARRSRAIAWTTGRPREADRRDALHSTLVRRRGAAGRRGLRL